MLAKLNMASVTDQTTRDMHLCFPLLTLSQAKESSPVLKFADRAISGKDLLFRVASLSRSLSNQLRLNVGAVVAIIGHNSDLLLECILAVTDAGCIAAPLNTRWSAKEIAAALNLVEASLVIADEACLHLAEKALQLMPASPVLCILGEHRGPYHTTEQLISSHLPPEQPYQRRHSPKTTSTSLPCELQLLSPSDNTAMFVFTSGTTGEPKAVCLSHCAFHIQSLCKLAVVQYSANDIYLHIAPLFHIGGLSSAFAVLMAGACQIFVDKFSAQVATQTIYEAGVTAFIAVPAMLHDMVQQRIVLQKVHKILVGAGPVTTPLLEKVIEMFPQATLFSAYGMTEACSSMSFCLLYAPLSSCPSASCKSWGCHIPPKLPGIHSAVCVGRPAPGIHIRTQPTGCTDEIGEVQTRGAHIMTSYWRNSRETLKAFTTDGWLRTGDLGFIDSHGQLWLCGRAKDTIKSGGENVLAAEVETVLCMHPAVEAASVVGLPDSRLGEQVAALLVLKPGFAWHRSSSCISGNTDPGLPTPPEQQCAVGTTCPPGGLDLFNVQSHCRQAGLSGYKLPRFAIGQYEPLPINSSGKVRKADVVQLLLQAKGMYHPVSRL